MRLSPPAALLSILLPAVVHAGKEVVDADDKVTTCAGQVASKNVLYNYVDVEDPPTPPLLLSKIVTDGDDGTCAIASWGLGKVVTYLPNPGFVGQDTCTYESCLDLDKDGEISAEEASRRCVEATLLIIVEDCDTPSPTQGPTPAPTPKPTQTPTPPPTNMPTMKPTDAPTKGPTDQPTKVPTDQPTKEPTNPPTPKPTVGQGIDDDMSTCIDTAVSTNVVWNDVDGDDAPLLLSRIVTSGNDGTCAIAAWGMGLVVTYSPKPGFVGQDACGYEACEDLDGNGEISAGERATGGRCVSASVRISVDVCETDTPTLAPTTTRQPSAMPVTSAPTICQERKFSYSPQAGCSNREEDAIISGAIMFETGEQCCIVEVPDPSEECIVSDACATVSPTKKPTVPPTNKPTMPPTRTPSYNPTTLAPSPSPTEKTTWGATPTVGTEATSAPVKPRGNKLRNMM